MVRLEGSAELGDEVVVGVAHGENPMWPRPIASAVHLVLPV